MNYTGLFLGYFMPLSTAVRGRADHDAQSAFGFILIGFFQPEVEDI